MFQLKQAQDLESQRQKKNVTIEGTLHALVEFYLNRKDPVRKAKRQMVRGKLDTIRPEKNSSHEQLGTLSQDKNCSHEQLDTSYQEKNSSHEQLGSSQKRTVAKKNLESSQTTPTKTKSSTHIKPRRQPLPAHVVHQVGISER